MPLSHRKKSRFFFASFRSGRLPAENTFARLTYRENFETIQSNRPVSLRRNADEMTWVNVFLSLLTVANGGFNYKVNYTKTNGGCYFRELFFFSQTRPSGSLITGVPPGDL